MILQRFSRHLGALALLILAPAATAVASDVTRSVPRRLAPEEVRSLSTLAGDPRLEPWQREMARALASAAAQGPAGAAATAPTTLATDAEWQVIPPPSARDGHTAIYDPVRDRMIVFGGTDGTERNDLWCLSLSGTPEWSRLIPAGTPPFGRYWHTAIYDPVRDRMIVFGGHERTDYGSNECNETWSLSLSGTPTWTPIGRGPLPPIRREHTAIYDPLRDRMVVFGGFYNDSIHGDTWALSLSGEPTWSAITTGGVPPAPRYRHSAIYDPVRDRMIVFGGQGDSLFNDTWSLAFSEGDAWTRLDDHASAPHPRAEHTAIYDPAHDRMVVFGGADSLVHGEVWSLAFSDSNTWSEIVAAGRPPADRHRHAAIYDPVRQRMVIFGGLAPWRRCDAWALDLTGQPSWTALSLLAPPPPARALHAAVYDPARDRMLVFGGWDGMRMDDTWALSFSGTIGWSKLNPLGPAPPGRMEATAIYDARRDRMILWGGENDSGPLDDLWALSLAGRPAWTQLDVSGPGPAPRAVPAVVYDSARDRLILWGGSGYWSKTYFDDAWALWLGDEPRWEALRPGGAAPAARGRSTPLYDPLRDRMLLVGGYRYTPEFGYYGFDDVWSLDLAGGPAWHQLSPTGMPSRLIGVFYDPVRDRLCGAALAERDPFRYEFWSFSLDGSSSWTELASCGPGLTSWDPSMTYDPVRDRAIFFGGGDNYQILGETWTTGWNDPAKPSIACVAKPQVDGREVALRLLLSHDQQSDRAIDWTLTDARGWPGLPQRGRTVVAAASTETLAVRVALPDSGGSGGDTLRISACFAGAEGNAATCEQTVDDAITDVLAALVSADAETNRARIVWRITTGARVTVHRREESTPWAGVGEALAEGDLVRFEDHSVQAGKRYGYRLAWTDARGPVFAGETWLEIPRGPALALLGAWPNPARGAIHVNFTLPHGGRAAVELFDLAGRRVATEERWCDPGFHTTPIGDALAPGVYQVRLRFGENALNSRAVVTR